MIIALISPVDLIPLYINSYRQLFLCFPFIFSFFSIFKQKIALIQYFYVAHFFPPSLRSSIKYPTGHNFFSLEFQNAFLSHLYVWNVSIIYFFYFLFFSICVFVTKNKSRFLFVCCLFTFFVCVYWIFLHLFPFGRSFCFLNRNNNNNVVVLKKCVFIVLCLQWDTI